MAFQILDPNNKPIAIGVLDTEAANLWGKEVDPKWYATPLHTPEGLSLRDEFLFLRDNLNWFDKIGWLIHASRLETWQDVKDHLYSPFKDIDGFSESALREELPQYEGYFKLIEHWEEKGYKPQYVIE